MKSTETLHQAAKDDYDLQRQAPLPDEKDKLRTSVTEMLGETPNLFHGRYRANANRLETKLKHAEATKDEKGFLNVSTRTAGIIPNQRSIVSKKRSTQAVMVLFHDI